MWEGVKEKSKRTATDGGDGGCTFISCKSTKITTSYWITIDRRMLEPTKKIYPMSKDKEEAAARWQEGHKYNEVKSHTCQVSDLQTG